MFCPRCGCIIPDGSSLCPECGHRIKKDLIDGLGEEQPSKGDPVEVLSGRAKTYRMSMWIGTAISAVMILSIFLVWAEPGFTGIDLVLERPIYGNNSGVLCTMPFFCSVLGMACLTFFITGRGSGAALFPLSLFSLALSVLFCVQLSGFSAYSAGIGPYVCCICSGLIAIMGLRNMHGHAL